MGTAILPLCGLTKVDCSVCRSWQAITVERLLPSTNTGMLCLILPGQPASGRLLWTRKTGARDLGTLPGGSYSRAHDLNDSDEVAGVAASPAGDRAFCGRRAVMHVTLVTLPGDLTSDNGDQ